MLDKYFNGVIEQVYHRIGTEEKNIVMASYNNDFSVSALENIKRYQGDDNVFFTSCELKYGEICEAYEPFLATPLAGVGSALLLYSNVNSAASRGENLTESSGCAILPSSPTNLASITMD